MPVSLFSESELSAASVSHIEPFWQSAVKTGSFQGKHDVPVSYAWCCPPQARQSVLISSGRIESLLKYKEVIYDLYHHGYAVFILDHRGQGLSGRMTDNPHHGYVANFTDYVDDLLTFHRQVITPHQRGALSLLCHSMGGAIGALTILREPGLFERAVFCSPMFGIRPALPEPVAKGLLWLGQRKAIKAGVIADYFFGQTDYQAVPFGLNKLTHSDVRYQLFRSLYEAEPAIQLGGVTTAWLAAARQAMAEITQQAPRLTLPCLLFSAGADKVVDNRVQRAVARAMPHCQWVEISGARHELLIEADRYRVPVMKQLLAFLDKS
ncbi:alpha/beta fold hydrolase [Salinimonas sediminis]|uniref:Alpha/beta fold hydrolase n=1 Tax=Salinimonas sediminis TaxID=2303538 RepID=A0A346NI62_9ALTE|nr:alpha/beta fold hydrolase [Salinimonas sediminis]AXR05219.1 alpha/beta fold hydrolase [Salinimonas sediminis]